MRQQRHIFILAAHWLGYEETGTVIHCWWDWKTIQTLKYNWATLSNTLNIRCWFKNSGVFI